MTRIARTSPRTTTAPPRLPLARASLLSTRTTDQTGCPSGERVTAFLTVLPYATTDGLLAGVLEWTAADPLSLIRVQFTPSDAAAVAGPRGYGATMQALTLLLFTEAAAQLQRSNPWAADRWEQAARRLDAYIVDFCEAMLEDGLAATETRLIAHVRATGRLVSPLVHASGRLVSPLVHASV